MPIFTTNIAHLDVTVCLKGFKSHFKPTVCMLSMSYRATAPLLVFYCQCHFHFPHAFFTETLSRESKVTLEHTFESCRVLSGLVEYFRSFWGRPRNLCEGLSV